MRQPKLIIYLHGWKGNPEANSKRHVAEAFPDVRIEAFPIDYVGNFEANLANMEEQILKLAKDLHEEEVVLFGNSAGGFWANHFANKYGFRLVLSNPSLELPARLALYGVDPVEVAKYARFPVAKEGAIDCLAFISAEDDIIDPEVNKRRLANWILVPGEGHRIKDYSVVIEGMKNHL